MVCANACPRHRLAALIGSQHRVVERTVMFGHLANEEGSRDVCIVALIGSAEIEQQRIAAPYPVIGAGLCVRLGGVVAGGDNRLEGKPVRPVGKHLPDKDGFDFPLG